MRVRAREPLTPERRELAERYMPLARWLARPFVSRRRDHGDDFVSSAYLGLVEAAEAFDPARNVKFATFARTRIVGALLDMQRALMIAGYRCDPEAAPTLTSLPPDPQGRGRMLGADALGRVGAEVDEIDAVEARLRRLPPAYARVMRLLYLDGMSQAEAGRAVGLSQPRVTVIHRESLAMLSGRWDRTVRGEGDPACSCSDARTASGSRSPIAAAT